MEHLELLWRQLNAEQGEASKVAPRPVEASNQPCCDGVSSGHENNGRRCGRGLGGQGSGTVRDNDRNLMTKQVFSQRRQSFVVPLSPAVLNSDVAALCITCFFQPFSKSGDNTRIFPSRLANKKSDHRNATLLRARRERPSRCRTTDKRDELPPSQLIELHSVPSQGRTAGYPISKDQSGGVGLT